MNRLLLVVGFAFFTQLTHISAQLVLYTPTLNNLQVGQVVDIPIRVKNFNKIVGIQFPVQWDPAVLKYVGVNSFNVLNGVNIDNFGLIDTTLGIVRFNWYNAPQGGKTLADDSHLFKIKVKVIGALLTSSPISFPSNVLNFPIEATQFDPNVPISMSSELAVTTITATAAVGFTVGLEDELFADEPSAFEVSPNPFYSTINIFPKNNFGYKNCQISLRDAAGRLVFQETKNLLPSTGMEIDMDGVKNGIYFLIINSEHETFARTLVKAE